MALWIKPAPSGRAPNCGEKKPFVRHHLRASGCSASSTSFFSRKLGPQLVDLLVRRSSRRSPIGRLENAIHPSRAVCGNSGEKGALDRFLASAARRSNRGSNEATFSSSRRAPPPCSFRLPAAEAHLGRPTSLAAAPALVVKINATWAEVALPGRCCRSGWRDPSLAADVEGRPGAPFRPRPAGGPAVRPACGWASVQETALVEPDVPGGAPI